jgi:hypothetical protein
VLIEAEGAHADHLRDLLLEGEARQGPVRPAVGRRRGPGVHAHGSDGMAAAEHGQQGKGDGGGLHR